MSEKRIDPKDFPWRVHRDGLELQNGGRMTSGCKHRKGHLVACGGCYARTHLLLDLIESGKAADPVGLIRHVYEIMKSEKANP